MAMGWPERKKMRLKGASTSPCVSRTRCVRVVPYDWRMAPQRHEVMAERLRLALELFEAGEAMMRQRIRRQFPAIDSAAVERILVEWLRTRPGAEHGDGAG